MRDLEIRGAGNILGTQQSGHIAAVGYELYCQLLENAVRAMKNLPLKTPLEVTSTCPGRPICRAITCRARSCASRSIAGWPASATVDRLDDFRKELRDRYGPVPEPAEWLLRLAELRLLAARWQIATIHRNGPDIVLTYRSEKRIKQLVERSKGRLKVVDDRSAYLRLREGEDQAEKLYALLTRLLTEE